MSGSTKSLFTDVHGYGTVASRPAAGTVGREYFGTDTGLVYRDNGTSWDTLAIGGSVPTYLDFTDQGGDPSSPSAGSHRLYSKSGGLYVKDSSGTVVGALGSGGGGGAATYPALKPGTPTEDFTAALDASWGVHSVGGTFVIGNCITGGWEWGNSALELQYSEQMGTMKKTQGNTDFDFTFGGVRKSGLGASMMFGIAALNSTGTGVGVIAYNDGNCYFVAISSYQYASNSASWADHSWQIGASGEYWFRLKRVSGTWTGYISQSGRAWDKTFATRSDSITVSDIHFGLFYNTATLYSGRLIADYYQKDV